MYYIKLNKDHSWIATNKEVIMQRSKLINTICFLVDPNDYNLHLDVNNVVYLQYTKPISKAYKGMYLHPEEDLYKGYIQYQLPMDTEFTVENGDLALNLTFFWTELDSDGNVVSRVRKTQDAIVHITSVESWCNFIPDSDLSDLDQRIIKLDAQLKAAHELAQYNYQNKADNIRINDKDNTLQLLAEGKEIGDKVTLKSDYDEDGIPIIDLDSLPEDTYPDDDTGTVVEEDNVVEF